MNENKRETLLSNIDIDNRNINNRNINNRKIDIDYEIGRINSWLLYMLPDDLQEWEIALMDMWGGQEWKERRQNNA
jgi:tricorn protease-like protein